MSIGQISGPLLTKNLLRNGVDLSFETDLLYLDVNTSKIGIKTQYPSRELEANNTIKTTNIIVDNDAKIANIEIDSSGIARTTGIGDINLNATTEIRADNIATDNLLINDTLISATTLNTDIELRPTKYLQVRSNVDITGGLHVTSNITFDGTITFGNSNTDNIAFNSDVASDLIPITDNTKSLGSVNKVWKNVWNDNAEINLGEIGTLYTDDNVNYASRIGNTYFVSSNGSDTNQGNHPNSAFATIGKALSLATNGYQVHIFPGTYYEDFPLTVPAGVTVNGIGLRSVNIKPTSLTNSKDAFLLNGETTVSNLTISDFYYYETANTGHAFRFADDLLVSSRSPYINNVSVITKSGIGNITSTTPTSVVHGTGPISQSPHSTFGFAIRKSDYADIGGYITTYAPLTAVIQSGYIDPPGYYTVIGIEEDSTNIDYWFINTAEEFNPAQPGLSLTLYGIGASYIVVDALYSYWDYTYIEYNKSDLPVDFGTTVGTDWIYTSSVNYYGGSSWIVDSVVDMGTIWRINFTATFSAPIGQALFVSPTTVSTSASLPAGRGAYIDGSVANIESNEASMLFHSCTFITPDVDCITMLNGVRVEWLNSFTYFAYRGLYALNGYYGRQYLSTSPQIGPLPMLYAASSSTGGGSYFITAYGAEIRSIGSANVYGTYGAVADGEDTLMYLINHNFAYIGAGTSSVNDPTVVIPGNEAVELNSGKIYHSSINQSGDFRVGDVFNVDNATGTANINPSTTKILQDGYVNITNGTTNVFINATKIQANDIEISGHTIKSLTQSFNVASNINDINLQNNTNITGNLDISNDFRIDGTLTLGNQETDTITFDSRISQDLKPKYDNFYDLGSDARSKRWRNLYSTNLKLPEITVSSLAISSALTNQDLLISGNGTGKLTIEGVDFVNYTIKPTSAQDLVFSPSKSLVIDSDKALLLPVGNNTDRPTLLDGDLRFNSYTGYFQGNNINFGGIISSDTLTSLKAHPTNNSFIFSFNNSLVDYLDSQGLTVNKFKTASISFDNNIISTNNTDLRLSNNLGLLDINIQDILISENEIVNQSNSPLVFSYTGPNGYVKISGTNGVVVPVGTTLEQPLNPETAQLRYNTTVPQLEVYDGLSWRPAIGTEPTISIEEAEEINFLYNLVLG